MNIGRKYSLFTFLYVLLIIPASTFAQINWVQTNGPNGGYATAVGINMDGEIYSYYKERGVYFSIDTCSSWTFMGKDSISENINKFSFNSLCDVFANSSSNLYRLDKSNNLWIKIFSALPLNDVEINNQNHIFVTDDFGVSRSYDNGNTWNFTGIWNQVNTIDSNDSGYLFIGTQDSGIYRSLDFGVTFQQINDGLSGDDITINYITTNPNIAGHVFAGTNKGLYFSQNNGEIWNLIEFGFIISGIDIKKVIINSENHIFVTGEFQDPFYQNWHNIIWYSTDYGITWNMNVNGIPYNYASSIVFSSSHLGLAATRNGVFLSEDNGKNWRLKSGDLNFTSVNSMIANSNGYIFANSDGVIQASTDNGDSWYVLNNHPSFGESYRLAVSPNGTIFDGQYGNGVFRSLDNGSNWESCGPNYSHIGLISVTSDCTVFAGADFLYLPNLPTINAGMYRSFNNGYGFTLVNNGLPSNASFNSIAFGSNGQIFINIGSYIFYSIDNGDNWVQRQNGLPYGSKSLGINSQEIVFVLIGSQIYQSTDSGDNWFRVDNGSIAGQGLFLFIDKTDRLYVGTAHNGIFISTDNGVNWFPSNIGLTNLNIKSIMTDSDGYLYAGTEGSGVFRSEQPILSLRDNEHIPFETKIYQNYPNPFNPLTTISYQLENTSEVKLDVLNILGQKIKTLVNTKQKPGDYDVQWNGVNDNGKNAASGLYIYHFKATSINENSSVEDIKKMILLR